MAEQKITNVDELDDFVDTMSTAYVFATDANGRPWLIYATEDELWAVSFPIETAEGPNGPVQVGDVIVRPEELDLPLSIIYWPDVQPTVKPSYERIAQEIGHALHEGGDWVRSGANAILALLPGRTEAEVKAEAVQEFRAAMPDGTEWLAQHDAEVRQELVARIETELDHAYFNGHRLHPDCQGVGPGEVVPAVRVSFIRAALEARHG